MATKVLMFKLLQEIRGFAEVTNRRPQLRSPGLVLIQLRSSAHAKLPPRKRSIEIAMKDLADIPRPVRIVHVGASAGPGTSL
jgi:hypothetical protein